MHAHHDSLAGFDPRNVLHDGCEECEERAANPLGLGIPALDQRNRLKLWQEMRTFRMKGNFSSGRTVSRCDSRIIDALYSIACFMQRAGISVEEIEERMTAENQRFEDALAARRA